MKGGGGDACCCCTTGVLVGGCCDGGGTTGGGGVGKMGGGGDKNAKGRGGPTVTPTDANAATAFLWSCSAVVVDGRVMVETVGMVLSPNRLI